MKYTISIFYWIIAGALGLWHLIVHLYRKYDAWNKSQDYLLKPLGLASDGVPLHELTPEQYHERYKTYMKGGVYPRVYLEGDSVM